MDTPDEIPTKLQAGLMRLNVSDIRANATAEGERNDQTIPPHYLIPVVTD